MKTGDVGTLCVPLSILSKSSGMVRARAFAEKLIVITPKKIRKKNKNAKTQRKSPYVPLATLALLGSVCGGDSTLRGVWDVSTVAGTRHEPLPTFAQQYTLRSLIPISNAPTNPLTNFLVPYYIVCC